MFFRSAELCRNVHPDPAFVRAAGDAYEKISTMTVALNADRALYTPLNNLLATNLPLTNEQHAMLASLKTDFERGGILLDPASRDRVADLQNRANTLGAIFSANISKETAFLAVDASRLKGIPFRLIEGLERDRNGRVRVPVTDGDISAMVMKVEDAEVRRELYIAGTNRCAAVNLPVLDDLLEVRRDIAEMLGAKGYAELMFEGRLASEPAAVRSFLEEFSGILKDAAVKENRRLKKGRLEAWDRGYYMSRVSDTTLDECSGSVAEYLPLERCLMGIKAVMNQTFGISMQSVCRDECEDELWHSDVEKIELKRGKDVVGHVFLDLYPREGKYCHAAHFAVRCGRYKGDGSPYQTPVVALVCNFTRISAFSPALLSFGEYETLWHEWGHAMHSLLSRTSYQHLSGTRVATDLVEIPSHIFEHFAWDPRVLSQTAAHYRTGDAMPTRLVHAMCASRHRYSATELQRQALYSCLDLEFHGSSPPIGCTSSAAAVVHGRMNMAVPFVEGTASHASFQHFAGYGAGYYSYVYARILSSQIWEKLFVDDPFCRASGDHLTTAMLECGAAKSPQSVLSDVLDGDAPSCESYIRAIGLECKELLLPLSNKAN